MSERSEAKRGFRRPRLTAAFLLGALAAVSAHLVVPDTRLSTSAIVGWNMFCAVYLLAMLSAVRSRTPAQIRARAAIEDEGRGLILGLVLLASIVSLAAMAAELSFARTAHGLDKAFHVGAAFLSVTASWLVVQVIFALHYAHEYYTAGPGGEDRRGLAFPGDEPPDYWDFLHFSIVIGVAAQTADIGFTAKPLRRLGTLHSLIAFAFNTVVVALTINLLAGLF